jgi:hypothetical protein
MFEYELTYRRDAVVRAAALCSQELRRRWPTVHCLPGYATPPSRQDCRGAVEPRDAGEALAIPLEVALLRGHVGFRCAGSGANFLAELSSTPVYARYARRVEAE